MEGNRRDYDMGEFIRGDRRNVLRNIGDTELVSRPGVLLCIPASAVTLYFYTVIL